MIWLQAKKNQNSNSQKESSENGSLRFKEALDEMFEDLKSEELKAMLEVFRVDAEGLSTEEIFLLIGAKYFSEMREGESVESSVAEVKF